MLTLFSFLTLLLVSTKSPQLPYVVKFLLIAAYLASYNPPKSDQRFFSKVINHTSYIYMSLIRLI